jgi:acetate kinase
MNSGSSSLKFALYDMKRGTEARLAEGAIERIGLKNGTLWTRRPGKQVIKEVHGRFPDHKAAVRKTFTTLQRFNLPHPAAVGHRLVHGGPDHVAPSEVDGELLDRLRGLVPFAPLHLPCEIQCIEAVAARFSGLPQVACFDTAFHASMPELAQRFPLPRPLWEEGLRRYGFHGLSYEYILDALGAAAQGRVIIAHLGNGASLAAVHGGHPLDTTMGFTPTGGLMMGTRCGDVDPGILLYLIEAKGYGPTQIEDLVNHKSGLLGVSEISSDMKTLLEKAGTEPYAAQAIDMFCYQVRKYVGSMAAVLGGVDTLVFTGGIGERAAPVRWRVCHGLSHLGIYLELKKNEIHADTITKPESPCTVRVIPTNEDLIIARHTCRLIFSEQKIEF